MKNFSKELKREVAKGKIEDVIEIMQGLNLEIQYYNQLILIQAQYHRLLKERNVGLIDFQSSEVLYHKLIIRLIELIDRVSPILEKKQNSPVFSYANINKYFQIADSLKKIISSESGKFSENILNQELEFYSGLPILNESEKKYLIENISTYRDPNSPFLLKKQSQEKILLNIIKNGDVLIEVGGLPLIIKMLESIGLSIDDFEIKNQKNLVLKVEEKGEKIKILFLGSNPSNSSKLRLDKEVHEIDMSLKLARLRDFFELKQHWAVTPKSLMQVLLDESPNIIHFSGHGFEEGIALENELGHIKVVSNEALTDLFELVKKDTNCVILNSCFSKLQAKSIRMHIKNVIGMKSSVPDSAAIKFSTGFYQALGAGKNINEAFKYGVVSIKLDGITGSDLPVIIN